MKVKQLAGLMFCGALSCVPVRATQQEVIKQEVKQPTATLNRYGFFSTQTYAAEPQIEAVLLLTIEQQRKLKAISDELLLPLSLQEARRKREDRQTGKQPTLEERKAAELTFMIQLIQAGREMQTRAKTVLTPDQNATVEKIEALFKGVAAEVTATYAVKIQAVDVDVRTKLEQERAEKVKAEVSVRLEALLSPEQKEALRKPIA